MPLRQVRIRKKVERGKFSAYISFLKKILISFFCRRDQISRVLGAAFLSQTDERRADLRIQLSLMCGDQFPAHFLLNSLFFNAAFCTTSSSGKLLHFILIHFFSFCVMDINLSSDGFMAFLYDF